MSSFFSLFANTVVVNYEQIIIPIAWERQNTLSRVGFSARINGKK